jgi:hypothetical protein
VFINTGARLLCTSDGVCSMYGYVHVATRRRRPTIPSHPRRQRSTLYATERAVLSRVCLLFSKISNLQQLRLLGIILTSGIRYRLCSSMLVPSATRTYKASHAAVWERADRPTSNSNCTDMSTLRRADDVPRSPLTPDANAQRYTRLRELCSLEFCLLFSKISNLQRLRLLGIILTSGIRYRLCSSMLVPSATRTYKARSYLAFD